MEPKTSIHIPVLLHEVIQNLLVSPLPEEFIFVDGTLGGAGHSLAIAEALKGKLTLIGLDRDPDALIRDQKILEGKAKRVILENADYRNIDTVLDKHGISKVDAILLDLGISSDELDNSGKGFSFLRDEPLIMTMDDPKKHLFTAKDIVNKWEEETIADVIFGYGEERYARRIAKAIVDYRQNKPIETTKDLREIIIGAVPARYRHSKLHPATRTFQALRITVNDELGALREGLKKSYERLNPQGRMAVISFHSLEDRIVKEFNKEQSVNGATIVNKKPITASPEEMAVNPRSRSAKLRVIIKTDLIS